MIQETKVEFLSRMGLTSNGFEEVKNHYTENSEGGVIHHKITTSVFKDGELISKTNHRQVLDPLSKDYSDKLAIVSDGVMGTLAREQDLLIRNKDAEISKHIEDKDLLSSNLISAAKDLLLLKNQRDSAVAQRDTLITEKIARDAKGK